MTGHSALCPTHEYGPWYIFIFLVRLFSKPPFSQAPCRNNLCAYLLLLVFGSTCDTTSSGDVDISIAKGNVVVSLYDAILPAVASVPFDMSITDVVVVAMPSVVVTESPRNVVDDIATDEDVTLVSTSEKPKVKFVSSANGNTHYLPIIVRMFYRSAFRQNNVISQLLVQHWCVESKARYKVSPWKFSDYLSVFVRHQLQKIIVRRKWNTIYLTEQI